MTVDLNLSQGAPVVKDADFLKQQINVLFDTTPGDLHGDIEFGTDYEKCLYELGLSGDELAQKMRNDITKMDLQGFKPQISAMLLDGTEREIAVIQVDLVRGYERYSNTYKIE